MTGSTAGGGVMTTALIDKTHENAEFQNPLSINYAFMQHIMGRSVAGKEAFEDGDLVGNSAASLLHSVDRGS
jgi:hypothetical protein